MKRKRLGEVLHERGKISAKDLEKALAEQEHKISYLGELLLERGLVEKSDLIAALEEVCLVPYVDIALTPVEPCGSSHGNLPSGVPFCRFAVIFLDW